MVNSFSGSLPDASEKELQAMNQLMAEKEYRIKPQANFFKPDKTDKVNPEFVLYTLNDYLGHLQNGIASSRKMIPFDAHGDDFFRELQALDHSAYRLFSVIKSFDIKQLSGMLADLQRNSREVTVIRLQPFIRLLFQYIIRVYYMGASGVAKKYRVVYSLVLQRYVPSDPEGLRLQATTAIQEWQYVFDHVFTGLYPLVLRMCSPSMLSMHQLYYANGSKVLAWLGLQPSEIIIMDESKETAGAAIGASLARAEPEEPEDDGVNLPDDVRKGLALLDDMFPEAGWNMLEAKPDMCAYFQPILEFNDAFTQLSPENPLHQMMILFWILEELFQGLRLIKFEPLPATSAIDDVEDINGILESWILYQEAIFDKSFAEDLKAFTHQVYTQPDYNKTPYGRKLLSNMYTLTRAMFLPHFNIQLYGTVKGPKDDRLPPFFTRVSRLMRLLTRYYSLIEEVDLADRDPDAGIPGIRNPWDQYKFDIANNISKRLESLLVNTHVKSRTNAVLIEYTMSILSVLDWWINDRTSYAYQEAPDYLYRVIEPGSSVPAFGVMPRTDVDALFVRRMKQLNASS